MKVRMDYRGARPAQRRLRTRAERMQDLSPLMRVYAERLRTMIDDSFEEQRNPAGQAWPQLQESTIKDRQRRRGPGPVRILIDKGGGGGLRGQWHTTGKRSSILFGNPLKYMPVHQFSGEHIPARAQAPVELRGGRVVWMNRAEGKRFRRDLDRGIKRYVATGRVR